MPEMIFAKPAITDVAAAAAFHEAIGFTKSEQFSNERGSGMVWSDTIHVMLFDRDFYATFTPKRITDAHTESGVLRARSFDDRAGVDAITEAVIAAGRREPHDPEDEGLLYGRAFADSEGHGWGPFTMDIATAGEGRR